MGNYDTNKIKPFDLKAALNGEPVMLGDGRKAYVRHHETELRPHALGRLLGYAEGDADDLFMSWREDGVHAKSRYEILGMWPKTHMVNGFEVTAPEVEKPEEGERYFTANPLCVKFCYPFAWRNDDYNNLLLARGLVFRHEEDALANAKAMLGINPYKN